MAKNPGKPAVLGPATNVELGIDFDTAVSPYLCGNAHWAPGARLTLSLPLGETPALEKVWETTQDSCLEYLDSEKVHMMVLCPDLQWVVAS